MRTRFRSRPARRALQDPRPQFRQRGALPLGEGHMPGDAFPFKSFHEIGQPVAARIQVGMVDLFRITRKHHFRSLSDPRHDRLDHLRAEILRLVADDELARDAPAPDVGQGFHFQNASVDQMLDDFHGFCPLRLRFPSVPARRGNPVFRLLRFLSVAEDELDVVENGLHPGPQLLLLVPGQKADVVSHRDDGPGDQQTRIVFSSRTFCNPTAIASRVLPVPARPTRVTALIWSLSSSSMANFCSLFRARIPKHSESPWINGSRRRLKCLLRADWDGLSGFFRIKN